VDGNVAGDIKEGSSVAVPFNGGDGKGEPEDVEEGGSKSISFP
jgi:hypothetical protein